MIFHAEDFILDESTKLYHDREELLRSLKSCFSEGPDVDFHGIYELSDAGITHKQRIQTVTHEIWKATGYRFTSVINFSLVIDIFECSQLSNFPESKITLRSPTDIRRDFGAHRTKLTVPSHLGQRERLKEVATHLV